MSWGDSPGVGFERCESGLRLEGRRKGLGLRVLGFRGLGLRVLGFRGLGLRVLGFRGLGLTVEDGFHKPYLSHL